MENKDIILFILVIVVVYLLYRDIINRREKFAETTSSTGAKPTTIISTKNGESMNITEAIKNLGIIAKQLQKDNNFVFPGNLTVEGKLTVKESIEIPDVIDFGKKREDDGRRIIQFGNPEIPGNYLDIAMNFNHIRDADVIYCKQLGGPAEGIKIGNTLNLNGNVINNVKKIYAGEIESPGNIFANKLYINDQAKILNVKALNIKAGEIQRGVEIDAPFEEGNFNAIE